MIIGEVASSGVARGPAFVCACAEDSIVPRRTIAASEAPEEMERFDAAVCAAEQDLLKLQQAVLREIGKSEAGIMEAQILLLHDPTLREEVSTRCVTGKLNVEAAVDEAIEKLTSVFLRLEDPYFRERAADLRDVGKRLLDVLLKDQRPGIPILPDGGILVTTELLPSVMAQLDGQTLRGLVAEKGGQNCPCHDSRSRAGHPFVDSRPRRHDANPAGRPTHRGWLGGPGLHQPHAGDSARVRPAGSRSSGASDCLEGFDRLAGGDARWRPDQALRQHWQISRRGDSRHIERRWRGAVSDRICLSRPGSFSVGGGAVPDVSDNRGPSEATRSGDPGIGHRQRQTAAVLSVASRSQSVIGAPGHPAAAGASRDPASSVARHSSSERDSSRLHSLSHGRRRGRSPRGQGGHRKRESELWQPNTSRSTPMSQLAR